MLIVNYLFDAKVAKGAESAKGKGEYFEMRNENRRQTECNQACLNCRGAKEENKRSLLIFFPMISVGKMIQIPVTFVVAGIFLCIPKPVAH